MQETQIQSLGEEEPLEKEMASHSGILAWEILQAEEPGGLYTPWGHRELDVTEQLTDRHTHSNKMCWLLQTGPQEGAE